MTYLKRKGISLSPKVYFIDALSYMALGLFATLVVGLILKQQAACYHFLSSWKWERSQWG